MLMNEIPSDDFQMSGQEFHLCKKKESAQQREKEIFTSRFVNDIRQCRGRKHLSTKPNRQDV